MKTLKWALAALFLTATALAQSIDITAPDKAASGTSYSVSVSYNLGI